jgi:hypothetical protein
MKNFKSLMIGIFAVFAVALSIIGSTSAFALDRHVTVYNDKGSSMLTLRGTNTGDPNWGPDLLGSGTIPPGYHARVNFDDGSRRCFYDLKATFDDGTTVIRNNVNVCVAVAWRIDPFANTIG